MTVTVGQVAAQLFDCNEEDVQFSKLTLPQIVQLVLALQGCMMVTKNLPPQAMDIKATKARTIASLFNWIQEESTQFPIIKETYDA